MMAAHAEERIVEHDGRAMGVTTRRDGTVSIRHELRIDGDPDLVAAHREYSASEERSSSEDTSFSAGIEALLQRARAAYVHTCTECGQPWTRPEEVCSDCIIRAHHEREERDRREGWAPARFRWATAGFSAPEIAARVRDAGAIARVRKSIDAGSTRFVFVGPAGVGKTSLAVATAGEVWRRHSHLDPTFADAMALSTARQRSRLGHEADDVLDAMGAGLLIIDELGRHARSQWDSLPEIIWERHNSTKPTIYTSGAATVEALRTQLADDGFARRVIEGAVLVVMGAKGGK